MPSVMIRRHTDALEGLSVSITALTVDDLSWVFP